MAAVAHPVSDVVEEGARLLGVGAGILRSSFAVVGRGAWGDGKRLGLLEGGGELVHEPGEGDFVTHLIKGAGPVEFAHGAGEVVKGDLPGAVHPLKAHGVPRIDGQDGWISLPLDAGDVEVQDDLIIAGALAAGLPICHALVFHLALKGNVVGELFGFHIGEVVLGDEPTALEQHASPGGQIAVLTLIHVDDAAHIDIVIGGVGKVVLLEISLYHLVGGQFPVGDIAVYGRGLSYGREIIGVGLPGPGGVDNGTMPGIRRTPRQQQ